jgi:hypothetical protein
MTQVMYKDAMRNIKHRETLYRVLTVVSTTYKFYDTRLFEQALEEEEHSPTAEDGKSAD